MQSPRLSDATEAAVTAYLAAKADATRANAALYAAARRAAIALRDDGLTLSAVGDALGVTRARAHQLISSLSSGLEGEGTKERK